jgi:hypothetical protein
MGVSLSVFKIKEYKKEKFVGDKEVTTLNGQLTLKDLELMDELGSAKSTLKLKGYDKENDIANYEALHFSETIKNPVRVFFIDDYSDIQEEGLDINPIRIERGSQILENGYQEVFKFDVIIDFKTEEIFVFTKKNVALSFMKRLRHSKNLDFEIMEFDLSKIDEITELDNVWGLWEDGTGRCKKKAYFGTEVHKEEGVEIKNITSYNVVYVYEENSIGLIICRECRISSNSAILTNTDLFKIYKNLKVELKKNNGIKETSQ